MIQPGSKPRPWGWSMAMIDPALLELFQGRWAIWPLWEGGGNRIADVFGRVATDFNGFSGNPWVTSAIGPALQFSGAQFVQLPLQIGSFPRAYSMLVVSSYTLTTSNMCIACTCDAASVSDASTHEIQANTSAAGVNGFVRRNSGGGTSTCTSGDDVHDGRWSCTVATQFATNSVRCIVDGSTGSDSSGVNITTGTKTAMALGCSKQGTNRRFFTGYIGMFAIFDVPISYRLAYQISLDPFALIRPRPDLVRQKKKWFQKVGPRVMMAG